MSFSKQRINSTNDKSPIARLQFIHSYVDADGTHSYSWRRHHLQLNSTPSIFILTWCGTTPCSALFLGAWLELEVHFAMYNMSNPANNFIGRFSNVLLRLHEPKVIHSVTWEWDTSYDYVMRLFCGLIVSSVSRIRILMSLTKVFLVLFILKWGTNYIRRVLLLN